MEWLELTISTASTGIELTAAALNMWGYDSFIIDDQAEFEEFLDNNHDYWDYVDEELEKEMQGVSRIRLYLEDDASAMERIALLRSQLAALKELWPDAELGTLEISFESVREEDWENNWKQYYRPLPIGERLLVVPKWLNPEDPENRIRVLLDPGMIFGTGNHASTRMCMKELERLVKGGEHVIDLGSGSGILSITALRLGAADAVALDIDPKAEDIARENAGFNGLSAPAFRALTGNVLSEGGSDRERLRREGGYDLVLANIVADVIIPLAPQVPLFLAEGGHFICSGILNTRLPEVEEALKAAGLCITASHMEEDWCQLTAVLGRD